MRRPTAQTAPGQVRDLPRGAVSRADCAPPGLPPPSLTTAHQLGKRGRQSPLNDAVQGVVSPHLTTVQGGRQSPLNDGCHYGIWSTGVVSPLLTTQCKGSSLPT